MPCGRRKPLAAEKDVFREAPFEALGRPLSVLAFKERDPQFCDSSRYDTEDVCAPLGKQCAAVAQAPAYQQADHRPPGEVLRPVVGSAHPRLERAADRIRVSPDE